VSSKTSPDFDVDRPPVRVLIADDHAIFRAALQGLLDAEPGFHVVAEAADGETAVDMARDIQPDIALVDFVLPCTDRVAVLHGIQRSSPSCRVVVLATQMDRSQIVEILQMGVRGIIMKDSPIDVLFKGIQAVVAGEHWVGRERVADLVALLRTGAAPFDGARPFGLTSREMEVVRAVVAGCTNREIAEKLSISPNTTKHHLSNVFDKLGVSNRLELALFAYHHAVVDEAPKPLEIAV
jgi:DNA-binding NarL/FixJ family response regulator